MAAEAAPKRRRLFFPGGLKLEEYSTILHEAEAEFTERRSRFIGRAKPITTEEEARKFIQSVRAMHREATHNVYAYVLREGQTRHCSDDGEPQGTAGVPTLNVLLKSGVTDMAVVVTRYFGGILLGAGGLIRAYSHGASIALQAAEPVRMGACLQESLFCDYSQYGKVLQTITECGGSVDMTGFGEHVALNFHVPCEKANVFRAALADATCGNCSAKLLAKKFYRIL